jgi:hypothetical protein
MNKNTTCSECGGKMQDGYILDYTYSGKDISSWVEGEPVKDFWDGGLSQRGKRVFRIVAFCCESCGFLKLYTGSDISLDK